MADTGVLRVPEATGTPAAPAELAAIIERYCGVDGLVETCVPGLAFYRATSTGGPVCSMYAAVLAIYAQGAKRVSLGDEAYVCDNRHYLVTSVDLPVEAQVIAASPAAPLLCCVLHLDARKIAALLSEIGPQAGTPPALARGIGVGRLTPDLADPVLRLARLAEAPADVAVLAPLVEREILYRLLCGELGARLRHIVGADGQGHRVARAIDWLKAHYAEPLAIDALADAVNMSKSSLHHHFKALTAMSPLQYQKQLRLQEARRLLLGGGQDVAVVARRVGYESPSQFSREYRRLFGAPPLKDVARLR